MTKYIDFKDQKAAREKQRTANNTNIVKSLGNRARPGPKAKTFSVAEWAKIVERMGRLGQVAGRMDAATSLEELKGLHQLLEHELTWLGRELAGGRA